MPLDVPTRLSLSTFALAAALGGVALADAARPSPHDHERGIHTGMGIDPFGHTRLVRRREATDGDRVRAEALTTVLGAAIARYSTTASAVAAGYVTTDERVPVGALKHYVSDENFTRSLKRFDPTAPMALLYRRTESGYELAGAMYAAPFGSTPDELDRRVPTAFAQWHAHVRICQPARTARAPTKAVDGFGFSGWIANAAECRRAGGTFIPVVYGWMAHVYPYERELAARF